MKERKRKFKDKLGWRDVRTNYRVREDFFKRK